MLNNGKKKRIFYEKLKGAIFCYLIWFHSPQTRLCFLKLANMCSQEVLHCRCGKITKKRQILVRLQGKVENLPDNYLGYQNLPDNYLGYSLFSWMNDWPCYISPNQEEHLFSHGILKMVSDTTPPHALEEICHLPQGKCMSEAWCIATLEQITMMQENISQNQTFDKVPASSQVGW